MTKKVLSLCDYTGIMVQPWLEGGYEAITVDLMATSNVSSGRTHWVEDVRNPDFHSKLKSEKFFAVFAFPPCTHTAVSGARWFKDKGLDGLIDALSILNACKKICEESGAKWMIENPVSTFSTYWRKPDHYFHPHDYTGYCTGDNYTKKTCLWVGNGFVMPGSNRDESLGKPDNRIHAMPPSVDRGAVRSATPLGFARAVFESNH